MQVRSGKSASKKPKKLRANGKRTNATRAWGDSLPSRSERAELKRSFIFREAAQSFNRAGFHGTSMDDIAKHLGVTKAALYRYVRNKHEVLFASFNLGLDSGFANLERGEREGANGLEKLRIALRGYLADLIGKLGHPVVLLEENALLPEQARAIIRRRDEAEKRFRALVKDGIKDGSIIPCEPKLAIFALLGAVSWVPKWYRDGGEWSPDQVAESLVDLILRSIAAQPGSRTSKTSSVARKQVVNSHDTQIGDR